MKRENVGVGNLFMFDPFAVLNLKKSYSLDPNILEEHYFEEQKKSHPDQFSQSRDQEKLDAVKKSTTVNQAYLILKDPLLRAEYLLKTAGIDPLSNDPAFLEQVMEWNERLAHGEDLKADLLYEKKNLLNELEDAFFLNDYEKARIALYQLTYVQKLLK